MIRPNIEAINDKPTRDALESFLEAFEALPFQGTGEFIELSVTGDQSDLKVAHRLRTKPKDVIVTSKIGSANITFHYADFTKDLISLTSTGALSPTDKTYIRFFLGTFKER